MTERELAREVARRLAIIRHAQEISGNVCLTCRYYGITRQSYYVWLRRYEELGIAGLRDRGIGSGRSVIRSRRLGCRKIGSRLVKIAAGSWSPPPRSRRPS